MFSSSDILFYYHLDLKSFFNLLKFFVIKTKIRESTHISKLWAETAESHIFLFFSLSSAFTRKKKQACTRVTQAGWVQLYLKHRRVHLEQGSLVLSEHISVLMAEGFSSHQCHSPLSKMPPSPQVLHSRGKFTNFHASTTCAGVRVKYISTRRFFTSGIHLGKIYTSMPNTVFLTSYFNGINCLIW